MHVIVLGINGFPHSFSAKVNRYKSISKMLINKGNTVTIINRSIGKVRPEGETFFSKKISVINAINFSFKSYTLNKYLKKIIFLFELITIIKETKRNRKKKIKTIYIVYTPSLFLYSVYLLLAKTLNVRLVFDYVEKRTEFEENSWLNRKMDKVFENKALKFADGIFVISSFLKNELKSNFPDQRVLLLPAISNFSVIDSIKVIPDIKMPYILYCGSDAYLDVVDFIVESYLRSGEGRELKLVLVISGISQIIAMLREKYSEHKNIVILSELPYDELIAYYKNAEALMIPLRNLKRDIARFPHKISEYTASKGLILSTNYGEIRHYFTNGVNALLSDDYTVDSFSKLISALQNSDKEKIRENAYKTGLKFFSEKGNDESVNKFLSEV
jgi:glycosyltransferase involved in cell wall biosynthesis